MSNEIKTYLKYAHLQIAAEALYDLQAESPGSKAVGPIDKLVLTDGNERSSKFTPTDAQWFSETWTVVEHISNTTAGFSGTLFRALKADPERGVVAGELVLSFRSTEFIDDAVRDNQATNALEIKEKGWAFGQIADMEGWFSSLKSSGKLDPGAAITVTGYSLGGHLATAFNLLHQNDLTAFGASLISATYTFNGAGAGVGKLKDGASLQSVIDTFTAVRDGGALGQFQTDEGRQLYQQIKSGLSVHSSASEIAAIRAQYGVWLDAAEDMGSAATGEFADYLLLAQALQRAQVVANEVTRVAGLDAPANGAPLGVALKHIAAAWLDYQLAVLIASQHAEAYPALWVFDEESGANNTLFDERNTAPTLIPGFHDIYANNFPTAVASSQWHYGQAVGVIVEDQPLHRGNYALEAAGASIWNWNTKLFERDFAHNDFGDTHRRTFKCKFAEHARNRRKIHA